MPGPAVSLMARAKSNLAASVALPPRRNSMAESIRDRRSSALSALEEWLQQNDVEVVRPEEVWDYLSRSPDTQRATRAAVVKAQALVPGRSRLHLEVYSDPEADDQYLSLLIRADDYPSTFHQILDEVQEEVLLALPAQAGWLVVSTDFARLA